MLLVTLSAFLPWFGKQGSAADLQWQPGGLEFFRQVCRLVELADGPPVWALTPQPALTYSKVQIRTFT